MRRTWPQLLAAAAVLLAACTGSDGAPAGWPDGDDPFVDAAGVVDDAGGGGGMDAGDIGPTDAGGPRDAGVADTDAGSAADAGGGCPVTAPDVCSGGCVNTRTDRNHCGDCTTVCAPTQGCVGGVCGSCPRGYMLCSTGECGRACL